MTKRTYGTGTIMQRGKTFRLRWRIGMERHSITVKGKSREEAEQILTRIQTTPAYRVKFCIICADVFTENAHNHVCCTSECAAQLNRSKDAIRSKRWRRKNPQAWNNWYHRQRELAEAAKAILEQREMANDGVI